jgi:hypothetical protein
MVPPANQGLCKLGESLLTCDQCARSRWIAEHLVKGQRNEIRLPPTEIKSVRRCVGRRIEQDVPAALLGRVEPTQIMLHAREVGLGRKGELLIPYYRFVQQLNQPLVIQPQVWRNDGCA